MNIKYERIIYIIFISILIIFIIYLLFRKSNFKKLFGGIHSDDLKLTKENIEIKYKRNNVFNPDTHFKYMLTKYCCINEYSYSDRSDIKYNKLICNEEFNNELNKIFKFKTPDSFKPDFIIECYNKIILVEADEGGDFHSNTKNINYVKKKLYYDKLIHKNIKNVPVIIFRFTYESGLDTKINKKIIENNFKGILDIQISKILNHIIENDDIENCYILYKYTPNIYNQVLKITNIENSSIKLIDLYNISPFEYVDNYVEKLDINLSPYNQMYGGTLDIDID